MAKLNFFYFFFASLTLCLKGQSPVNVINHQKAYSKLSHCFIDQALGYNLLWLRETVKDTSLLLISR